MGKWLSPMDVKEIFSVGRTTAYKLIKAYIDTGGEYIRIGKLTRVPEIPFTEYLKSMTKRI